MYFKKNFAGQYYLTDVASTLKASDMDIGGSTLYTRQSNSEFTEGKPASALKARDYKDFTDVVVEIYEDEIPNNREPSK